MFNIKTTKVSEYILVILKPFTPSRVSLPCYYVHHARIGDVTYALGVYTTRGHYLLQRYLRRSSTHRY
jgi:hypothetical protein